MSTRSGLVTTLIILNLMSAGVGAPRLARAISQPSDDEKSNRPQPDLVTTGPSSGSELVAASSPRPATEQPAIENTAASLAVSTTLGLKAKALSLQPLLLPDAARLKPLDKAYLDAYSILRGGNDCSRFFGGPAAIEVLNQLTRQLKPAYFNRSIGLRMKGKISYVMNNATKLSYRLFESAELNTDGPFFKTTLFPMGSPVHRVGEFSPNTREARLTILLHELGHMIQRPNGEWVLPNDGDDPTTSKDNTQKVIEVCRQEIKGRGQVTFETALASMQSDREEAQARLTASVETTPSSNPLKKTASPELLRQIGSEIDARCDSCRREIQNPQDR